MPKAPSQRGLARRSRDWGSSGKNPFRLAAARQATFPKGTAFGGGGKVSGSAIRRPLGGAGERSEPEGVISAEAVNFPAESKSLAYRRRVRYYILYTL